MTNDEAMRKDFCGDLLVPDVLFFRDRVEGRLCNIFFLAGYGDKPGCGVRCGIVSCEGYPHDQITVKRAKANVRLFSLRHGADEGVLAEIVRVNRLEACNSLAFRHSFLI